MNAELRTPNAERKMGGRHPATEGAEVTEPEQIDVTMWSDFVPFGERVRLIAKVARICFRLLITGFWSVHYTGKARQWVKS